MTGRDAVGPRGEFRVVDAFERALERYTGCQHAVTVDSCTNALFLALTYQWHRRPGFEIGYGAYVVLPRRTYVGVAQAARNAGYAIRWSDDAWWGAYRIEPVAVIDAAKRFTSGMARGVGRDLMCVSFQASKILPIGRGGAILTDDEDAAVWFQRARMDGRTPGSQTAPIQVPGWHMYLDPPSAARGLWLLAGLPEKHDDLPCDDYPDLSEEGAFR